MGYIERDSLHTGADDVIKELQQSLAQSVARYETLVSESPETIVIITEDTISYINPAGVAMFGASSQSELLDQPFMERLHSDDHKIVLERLRTLQNIGDKTSPHHERFIRLDGRIIDVEVKSIRIPDDGGSATLVMARDISEHITAQHAMNYMVSYDSLTGLPNRRLFQEELAASIAGCIDRAWMVAILFLDLDRFKTINDSFGHEAGDQLLLHVCERLSTTVPKDAFIARVGGDEFTIILPHVSHRAEVMTVVRYVMDSLTNVPFIVFKEEIFMTASIGISVFPDDGEDALTLFRNADMAMYQAKSIGKNNYQFYNAVMNSTGVATKQVVLERALRRALEQEELYLVYQPKFDLKTGHIVGLEALLRWNNRALGPVSPAEFIPLAEETGLIVPIGEYVLRSACEQSRIWQEQGYEPLCIAVNISARQFLTSDLANTVQRILRETDLDGHLLELEITESLLIQNTELIVQMLYKIKAMGVQISIDDFGTGYSSLSYLKRFPVDRLKIDQSFIRDLTWDSDNAEIATAIISMGHSLRLKVIAEGVETEEQKQFLFERRCDEMQGFLLSRPLLSTDIISFFSVK